MERRQQNPVEALNPLRPGTTQKNVKNGENIVYAFIYIGKQMFLLFTAKSKLVADIFFVHIC